MPSNHIDTAPKKRALVLSGGSIKGAYQAGVVERLFHHGFKPDTIYGVSVGALNGLFLAHASGHHEVAAGSVPWQDIGQQLRAFWLENITSPHSIVRARSKTSLAIRVLFNRHAGFLDTKPLRRIVHSLDRDQLSRSRAEFYAGVVDLFDASYEDVHHGNPRIHEYVMASSSLPLLMPVELMGSRALQDGGLINVTPIANAIKQGADQIVVVMCQEEQSPASQFKVGSILEQAERVLNVMNSEVIRQDIEMALKINQYLIECGDTPPPQVGLMKGKRKLDITVIRPKQELKIDIRKFTKTDIHRVLDEGNQDAEAEREARKNGW